MTLDPEIKRSAGRTARWSLATAALLVALPLLAGCGSKPKPVVTGSTTTCVPMGKSVSCSCTPIAPSGS
jgi:hypothetical protein